MAFTIAVVDIILVAVFALFPRLPLMELNIRTDSISHVASRKAEIVVQRLSKNFAKNMSDQAQ